MRARQAMRPLLDVLRLPGFARLQAALFVNSFGNWMLTIALPLYVLRVTGSTVQTAATLAIEIVVKLSVGQVAGVWVDRWNRRIAFAVVSATQAVVLLPLATVHGHHPDMWVVYAVTAGQALLGTVGGPAVGALIPTVVPRERRVQANGLASVLGDIAQLVGGAAGGLVLGSTGLPLVVGVDAVTFVIAAALMSRRLLPDEHAPTRSPDKPRSLLGEWREGLAVVRHNRQLFGVFVVAFILFFGQGLYLVLFVAFAIRTAHIPDSVAGTLRAVIAAGTLIGGGLLAVLGDRFRPHKLAAFGLIGSGVFMALAWNGPLFHAPTIYYVAVFCCVGIPNVGAYVGMLSIFQDATPAATRGRVFSLFGAVTNSSALIGLLVAGLLASHLPTQLLLDLQALGFVVGGLVGWPLMRPAAAPAPSAAVAPPQPRSDDATALAGAGEVAVAD